MMTDRPAARRVLMTFCFDPQHVSKTDWRIHCGAGVTESSTNKQHHLGSLSLLRQHAHTHTQTHTRAHTSSLVCSACLAFSTSTRASACSAERAWSICKSSCLHRFPSVALLRPPRHPLRVLRLAACGCWVLHTYQHTPFSERSCVFGRLVRSCRCRDRDK